MKKVRPNLLLVVFMFLILLFFVACSEQTEISDGSYNLRNEGIKANPFNPPILIPPFEVAGSVITFSIDETVIKYEYQIKSNEIILTNEDGVETVHSFEKENNNTFYIDGWPFIKTD